MYPIEPWADRALRASHRVRVRAWSSVNGSAFIAPLPVVPGGEVRVTPNFVRRECTLRVIADVDAPEVSTTAAEVRIEYGVTQGVLTWWQTVGTFVVSTTKEVQSRGQPVVEMRGLDRSQRIVDARFEQPVTTSGSTVGAIEDLVLGADDRLTFTDHTGSGETHRRSVWERDRAEAVQKLAESIGAVLYMEPDGGAHLYPQPVVPQSAVNAVWQFGRGDGGAKVESAREVSREGVYNSYVVIGEAVDGKPSVYGVARDENPLSPTRHGGPFGKRPRFFQSSLLTSNAQARRAARAGLERVIGQAWTLDLSGLPNPALEHGDPISVEVEPGVWSAHYLDGYSLPLGPGIVTYQTRTTAGAQEGEA